MPRRRLLGLLAGLALAGSCRLYNLERRLDPANANFLSTVRYIISAEERRTFLELPDAEKPKFIEEFWRRRDPDPDTEDNEFRIEYLGRIAKANELFFSEGIPGWLTDRGRIFILFGPPNEKSSDPMGTSASGRCQEVWYYGNFPVVFIDAACTGNFRLVTYDLTELREINLMYMHDLSILQSAMMASAREEKIRFGFEARLRTDVRGPDRFAGTLVVELPYGRIWYTPEGKTLRTTLTLAVELMDARKSAVWEFRKDYALALDESELEAKAKTLYAIEIPVRLEGREVMARLEAGRSVFALALTNATGRETATKVLDFK